MNSQTIKQDNIAQQLRYLVGQNLLSSISLILFGVYVFIALTGSYWVPYDPLESNTTIALQGPSSQHFFGTDHLGRDVFSRVIVATRLDLGIALAAVSISFFVGTFLGALAGYYGGWYERLIGRLADIVLAFPLFVLAMGIVAVMGNSLINVIYATAIINIPFYIRISRAEVSLQRDRQYVQAALLSGNSHFRTLLFHILPNCLPNLIVQISINMGWAILNAAGLSFIGLGVRPPVAEWGILVAEGADYIISGQWWLVLFPGVVLMLAVFTFNLVGDTLRDLADPQKRK
ncbi:peptide ABC transporter permease [Marinomonas sp. UCMA 3892]|uniref:ABC transporter permease n=1 Tax=Marinomonas sp. UCMA 3892 TaxID=1972585 RepID=UPI00146DF579|nr:ABC transporter permease [Marinomonas sp. UCMA 3892]MBU1296516.1 ABC transporter permease [Gammaproteobacteria bacterium]MBU1467159.1 ABC transporter permease [Gammaproteobacteria bacterium]MBU2024031.1 ABC transporter permease [Gammaproteobacteria bacterium]MBU2240608.1 ABC transporter permease [Gammaproteobacteria bacterium]MBU2319104.1 ABC transporter permease [Gammaproteobacteria bacterium]